MIRSVLLFSLLVLPFFIISSRAAKTLDPYKILGVDKSASQREIQKSFHKLSLKYHPDKNKSKGAQEKFAEINNAYEILSDEDKKKNYDLYGDAQGDTGFDGGNFRNQEGYTYSTDGGYGGGHFASNPSEWQRAGGNSKPFSFSFAGDSSTTGRQFGFNLDDIFSNFFQKDMKKNSRNQHGGSSDASRSKPDSGNLQDIDLQLFNKKVRDQGMTWLLLFYTPSTMEYSMLESITLDTANSLIGIVKAGKINCHAEHGLCRELGVPSSRSARLFIYRYTNSGKSSLLEYNRDIDAKSLKNFCQEHLPRISKRVADIGPFEFPNSNENLPQVLLLSTKKDTPAMWRAITGQYRTKFAFHDAEVRDASNPFLKKLEVGALPALVGRLSNGDVYVLKAGIVVKNLQSGINELKSLLESFERKNKAASSQPTKREPNGKGIPLLSALNVDDICGVTTPACFIGVFWSQKGREKLDDILSALSQKTLVRHGGSISYSLLDAKKQSQVLSSFGTAGLKSLNMLLLAYKPKKGKFVAFNGELTMNEVEKFAASVLNGDAAFTMISQKPTFR